MKNPQNKYVYLSILLSSSVMDHQKADFNFLKFFILFDRTEKINRVVVESEREIHKNSSLATYRMRLMTNKNNAEMKLLETFHLSYLTYTSKTVYISYVCLWCNLLSFVRAGPTISSRQRIAYMKKNRKISLLAHH